MIFLLVLPLFVAMNLQPTPGETLRPFVAPVVTNGATDYTPTTGLLSGRDWREVLAPMVVRAQRVRDRWDR